MKKSYVTTFIEQDFQKKKTRLKKVTKGILKNCPYYFKGDYHLCQY